jgi:hypothetical protein
MKVKLSNEDRCAIDLVLEQRVAVDAGTGHCKPASGLKKRIKRVEKLFDLLGQLPAQEPPTTLLTTTLKYVRRHEHDTIGVQPSASKPATVSHTMSQRALQ